MLIMTHSPMAAEIKKYYKVFKKEWKTLAGTCLLVVIVTGNPGVPRHDPYPTRDKPVPVATGTG